MQHLTFAGPAGLPTRIEDDRQTSDGFCRTTPLPSAEQAGHGFAIRDLHAIDAAACALFFRSLDPHDIRMRFAARRAFSSDLFLAAPGEPVARLAIAAVDPADALLGIVNLACLDPDVAELAIIVRSDRQRLGIGRSLLAHAIRRTARDGFSQLVGHVLAENLPMLGLAHAMGFQRLRRESVFVVVSRPLSAMPAADGADTGRHRSPQSPATDPPSPPPCPWGSPQ